jgi:cytochrome c biogenesis protein CcdA
MKQFLIRLVRIYFGLGAVFGGLGILSYFWGTATHANCGDFGLVVMVTAYAVFGAVVRTVLWLPSLIHWWLAGPEPFLQWLLPGLFITCGTSP